MSTNDLIKALTRHEKKRVSRNIYRRISQLTQENIDKRQNPSKSDLCKARTLKNKSFSDLKKLAKLRAIINYDDLSKEDLIYTLLRSEKSLFKDNYEKYISNNTIDELRSRTNVIRMLLARLGDIITKKDRDKIRKKLHKIENKQKLTKTQKEKYLNYLIELVNFLDKKEKYMHKDYDDINYTGIRNIENLFISTDDYYEPVLVKSSFDGNYEYYEIKGDKDKKLSARQYLYMI